MIKQWNNKGIQRENLDNMIHSVYFHIPFCDTICSYCDFPKVLSFFPWIEKYLVQLEKEIRMNYKGDTIKTIYIGGGTPSILSLEQLRKLFKIVSIFRKSAMYEFTFEGNPESLTEEKLLFLKENGVNRLSIGVESFQLKLLQKMNRHHTKEDVLKVIECAKRLGFSNINIDLIYAFEEETNEDLKRDLNDFLSLDVPHISTYSLILEEHTKFYIEKRKPISEESDFSMYQLIQKTLKEYGYEQYEISNFARKGYFSKHNLTYWNNDYYYGFGMGASGYVKGYRYHNTRSILKYLSGSFLFCQEEITRQMELEYAFLLGFRKTKGILKKDFFDRYHLVLEEIPVVKRLLGEKKLVDKGDFICVDCHYLYVENSILLEFIGEKYE